jgi:hypothetical protein
MNKKYQIMYQKFLKNEITEYEWKLFCQCYLYQLMEKEKEVFIRLKNR